MAKITVELVKYDTEKTTKRKRKNLIVEARSEQAVIDKLEKIHKGDKIKTIHEIVWSEDEKSEREPSAIFTGTVKFFDEEKGFGFIQPDEEMDDLFFHKSALGGAKLFNQDVVEFEISDGPKGAVAVKIKFVE